MTFEAALPREAGLLFQSVFDAFCQVPFGFEVQQRLSLGDVVDEDGEVEDAGGFDFHGEVGLHGVDAAFADVFDAGGSAGADVVGLASVFGFDD